LQQLLIAQSRMRRLWGFVHTHNGSAFIKRTDFLFVHEYSARESGAVWTQVTECLLKNSEAAMQTVANVETSILELVFIQQVNATGVSDHRLE
jgi:hypothetical protein